MRLSEWENVRRKEGFLVARSFLEDVIHTLQSNSKQGANARIFRLNDNEFACVLQHLTRDELVKLLNDLSSDLARLQGRYQQKKEVLIGAVLWHSNDDMSAVMKAADEAVLMATKERWQFHLYEPSERIKKVSDMLATREGVLLAINESSLHLSQHGVMMSDQLNLMFSEVLSKIQYKDEIIPTLLLQSKAEQFSASAQLDKRIFDQIRALYIKGCLDLPVSINVSVHSVLDDEFYAWLMDQSHQYGDLFSSIIWEFDEMMLSQSQLAPQVITKLHKLGSKVAIDHFGTGDNTLLALRKWPVDIVKLDGSFIHELEQKQDSWYFLENIIKLAHSLGVVVVCEQLESEQQVKWAKELGSDGLQGFKLGLPHSVS
jgi:EAL domain-containing protein (putative c-di-GMP-specific phosphodiesterase class I)